jgi:outer membrane protein assembly factor BamB
VSAEVGLPSKWSAKENIAWRLELPGLGTSSPIVVGNQVFVTCYSGYAESAENPGDRSKLMRHIVSVDRSTGKVVWKNEIAPRLPESEYSGNNNTWHGYSSSTPVSDGRHLYVFFGKTGVFCFTLDGKQVWQTEVGDGTRGWGSANSPVLYENLVIVNASVESGQMVALDKATGEQEWTVGGIRGSWNTPCLVKTPDGRTELVVSLPQKILALDPATGNELWNCEGIPDQGYVCPSVIANEGIVYVIGGRKNTAIAVRVGGRGDVSKTHLVWRKDVGSNVSSPVYYDGHLYWVHERQGLVNCLNAATGEVVFQQRLEPRPGIVYASVVAADGKLYCPSQHAGVFVLAAKPKFELLAHNVFDDDDHRTNASIAVQDGQILLRNDKYLYCIGKRNDAVRLSTQ